MTITYRSMKGSPLSVSEADANTAQFDLKTKDGWRDLVASLDTRSGPTAPDLNLFKDGIYLYQFLPNDMQEVFANFHIDHDYKLGTMLYPHIHFSVNTNNSGVVRWGIEWMLARRHESTGQIAFPASTTSYVNITVGQNKAYTHFVCELPEGQGIPADQIEPDVVILARFFRDATHVDDTFPDPVFGITIDLHYEADRFATPFRAPGYY